MSWRHRTNAAAAPARPQCEPRARARVADRLQLFALAPSLGGVESLVTQPCTTTHYGRPAEERARRGIPDGLLRLSIGLEDTADLAE